MAVIVRTEQEAGVVDDGAASFDAYVAEHQAALVRYATRLAGSVTQAEDIVQEVLIRLYPRWSALNDPHSYVRRSITNEFISWRRRWTTRHVHAIPDAALVAAFDRQARASWTDDGGADPELWALLQGLPGQQRAAIVLRYWEGLPDDEIGAILGCRAGSVRAHVSRGLARLRSALGSKDD